eukprot:363526-Chlamydomonas_euryale.AAC.7
MQLACERGRLTLRRRPAATLLYFARALVCMAADALAWCARHPLMLFGVLPAAVAYIAAKAAGAAPHVLDGVEVGAMTRAAVHRVGPRDGCVRRVDPRGA